jgi:monoamine oxidase
MDDRCDAVVVGAGMAGLNLARLLARAGLSVRVLEARDRIGGRVFTENPGSSNAVELGAEFVHDEPAPTLKLAREAGVELFEVEDVHFEKRGSDFIEQKDAFSPLTRVLQRLSPDDADVSAAEFLHQHDFDEVTRTQFRALVEGFEAVPLDEVSIQSLKADADASESAKQYRVSGGYGELAEYLRRQAQASGARLDLNRRVLAVERQAGAVSLVCGAERLSARACILTLPLGVLLSEGAERFGLSSTLASALAQLGMGHAARVTFSFADDFWRNRLPPDASFVHQPGTLFGTFWQRRGNDGWLFTAWSGGPKARSLARLPESERLEAARAALAAMLDVQPEVILSQALATYAHDFSNDTFSRGAYSFVRPLGLRAPDRLQQGEPPIFLAGEALDHEYPGTVAGALASAERAARQVLGYLSRG